MHLNFKNKAQKKAYIRFVHRCGWIGNLPDHNMKRYANRHDITLDEMKEIAHKAIARFSRKMEKRFFNKTKEVLDILEYFKKIPYVYQGDGMDDFNKYQRPCSNGIGYVAICPGERGNNYYTENPTAIKILKRKYEEWLSKNS